MRFANLKLSSKLLAGFGSLLAITIVSLTYIYIQTVNLAEIERLNSVSDDAVDHADLMLAQLTEMRADIRRLVLTSAPADKASVEKDVNGWKKEFEALQAILQKEAPSLVPDLGAYRSAVDAMMDDFIKPEMAAAMDPAAHSQAIAMATHTASGDVQRVFADLRRKVDAWSQTYTEEGNQSMTSTMHIVIFTGLLLLAIGVLLIWFLTRAIGRPLNAMTQAIRSLASGDLSVTIPATDQTDEVGRIAGAVQVFKDAAIEKVRLEADASAMRRAADDDRARNEVLRTEAARQITQVVDGLAAGLDKLAAGDLIQRLDSPFAADYESLRTNFNMAVAQLQEAIEVVSVNTGAIRSGTGQISTASDDLSRRTEQQAASLEETAAALSEITTAVKKTAEGAVHARQVVKVASADAERSGEVVARTVTAMSGIERSSQQIGQIIGVIDEIAFQTNLLALNAGVEAARAGDAGRGFAVVASEVRGLAQRSAEAAKEIKTLILASDDQVKAGVQLVGETGKGLTRIVEQVAEISIIVNEIATSAEEQASGLSQVNIAVNQMDQVTQQNAAMVEEATAATHSLASDSEELARAVSRFQVGGSVVAMGRSGGGKARAPAPASHAPRPAARPAPARRTGGMTGGSAAAAQPKASNAPESWEEF